MPSNARTASTESATVSVAENNPYIRALVVIAVLLVLVGLGTVGATADPSLIYSGSGVTATGMLLVGVVIAAVGVISGLLAIAAAATTWRP